MFVLPVKFTKPGAVSAAPGFRKAKTDLVCLTVRGKGDKGPACTGHVPSKRASSVLAFYTWKIR